MMFYNFRAFDVNGVGHLSHKHIITGLAAMNICTQHGGPPGEVRCRYIFRFYDSNDDGTLETCEFRYLLLITSLFFFHYSCFYMQ